MSAVLGDTRSVFMVWTNEARWLEDQDWIVGVYFSLDDIPEEQALQTVEGFTSNENMALIVVQYYEGPQDMGVPLVQLRWRPETKDWGV